eukprot:g19734.t1
MVIHHGNAAAAEAEQGHLVTSVGGKSIFDEQSLEQLRGHDIDINIKDSHVNKYRDRVAHVRRQVGSVIDSAMQEDPQKQNSEGGRSEGGWSPSDAVGGGVRPHSDPAGDWEAEPEDLVKLVEPEMISRSFRRRRAAEAKLISMDQKMKKGMKCKNPSLYWLQSSYCTFKTATFNIIIFRYNYKSLSIEVVRRDELLEPELRAPYNYENYGNSEGPLYNNQNNQLGPSNAALERVDESSYPADGDSMTEAALLAAKNSKVAVLVGERVV